ncbi:hypothetical protein D3C78_1911450 [compost metagenome]
MTDIGNRFDGSNILVVSHGALLAQLYNVLYKEKCSERIGNLSLTILDKKDSDWDLHLYNCTRHIEVMMESSK